MQKYILIILLLLAACSGKKEIIDDRYIVFNVYSYKYVCPHSIILNFKDKTICIHNITNEVLTIEDVEITSNEDENRIEEKKLYKKPPLAIVKDNMIVDSLGILFNKVDSILQNKEPFSYKSEIPMPDQYVYLSFNYFKNKKHIHYSYNPQSKEWNIFYLVRDYIINNDTINGNELKTLYKK